MIFENMNVLDEIKKAVKEMGFRELTAIQEESIPLLLEGRDIIGQSQTGTGKTAAFAIPILQKMDMSVKTPQVLIMCPTRELAVQVAGEFRKIAKYMPSVKVLSVYGGEPISRQIMALKRGVQVIIGTPGRTIDHIRRKTLMVDTIHTLVLDEADEMLKMGFREDIETVLKMISNERQTVLFSATMPKPILDITKKYQNDPKLIKIQTKIVTADTIKQEYVEVDARHKTEALFRILKVNKPKKCIVFCNKKSVVDNIVDNLQARGYIAEKIHGDLKQELRLNVLKKFNNDIVNIMVATDVAARGLDIQNVDLIINYDVPENEDHYVHRIGRSGRAGKEGRSITIVSNGDQWRIRNIMNYTNKKIDKNDIPTLEEVNKKNIENFIDEVVDTIEKENLQDCYDILEQFDKEKYSVEEVAAALIKLNIKLHGKSELNDINLKYTKQTRGYNEDRKTSGNRRPSKKRRDDMTRMFINVGKKDDIKPNHILGAIIGECGVSGKHIGTIDMLEKFSFVDVDNDVAKKVLKNLKNKKINGRKVNIEIANK
jgi:ATP-dependent RNA helicase DeaD